MAAARHPDDQHLDFEALTLPGDQALTVVAYSAEPGTPSGDGLELPATWAATQQSTAAVQRRGSPR